MTWVGTPTKKVRWGCAMRQWEGRGALDHFLEVSGRERAAADDNTGHQRSEWLSQKRISKGQTRKPAHFIQKKKKKEPNWVKVGGISHASSLTKAYGDRGLAVSRERRRSSTNSRTYQVELIRSRERGNAAQGPLQLFGGGPQDGQGITVLQKSRQGGKTKKRCAGRRDPSVTGSKV